MVACCLRCLCCLCQYQRQCFCSLSLSLSLSVVLIRLGLAMILQAPATEKRITIKPFNLTKPKPRIVSEPEVLPGVGFQAKPIPETSKKGFSYEDTKEYKEMIQIRADNREREKAQYANPKIQKFKLASDERPTHLERLIEEKEAHIKEVTSFDFKAQPPPKLPKQPEIRMTATSIMREDALYKKKQEQEDSKSVDDLLAEGKSLGEVQRIL